MLAIFELRVGVAAPLTRVAARLSPLLLSAFTLVIGAMLLVPGMTPASHAASELLALRVPLPLVEPSHFIGRITGFAYLFLSLGILHRLYAPWGRSQARG